MSMTDRELLEQAAKACGIRYIGLGAADFGDNCIGDWNPLDNLSDAFKLMVDCKLSIGHDQKKPNLYQPFVMRYADAIGPYPVNGATEACGSNPYIAMRRAIVRAAAEIGKAMQAGN
jgi:hypothetical protein